MASNEITAILIFRRIWIAMENRQRHGPHVDFQWNVHKRDEHPLSYK